MVEPGSDPEGTPMANGVLVEQAPSDENGGSRARRWLYTGLAAVGITSFAFAAVPEDRLDIFGDLPRAPSEGELVSARSQLTREANDRYRRLESPQDRFVASFVTRWNVAAETRVSQQGGNGFAAGFHALFGTNKSVLISATPDGTQSCLGRDSYPPVYSDGAVGFYDPTTGELVIVPHGDYPEAPQLTFIGADSSEPGDLRPVGEVTIGVLEAAGCRVG